MYGPLGDYLLGYDLSPAELRKLLTKQRRLAEIADPDDAALLACEDGLLDIYAELGALYRPQTEAEPDDWRHRRRTPRSTWCRSCSGSMPIAPGSPTATDARLERALDRFGVRRARTDARSSSRR